MTMNLDDGGIDHGVFHVRLMRQSIENPLENVRFAPVTETPEHRIPVSELGRQVAPRTARSDNPQHRLHK